MAAKEQLSTLIQGVKHQDPKSYDILRMIVSELESTKQEVIRIIDERLTPEPVVTEDLLPPGNTTVTLPGSTLRLSWDAAIGAAYYEIRKGTDWSTSLFITRTTSLSVDLNPIATGSHSYLFKSVDGSGKVSSDTTVLTFIISEISPVVLNTQIIDNNVLFYWQVPESNPFGISYYNLYRNGTLIGSNTGTFSTVFETSAGTYTYAIEAVDPYGNKSALTEVTVSVSQPPDFELVATSNSSFSGTKTNMSAVSSGIIGPTVSETFEDHFINNSKNSIQDFIDTGYEVFIQPSNTSGTYEETVDFGTILNNVILVATWSEAQLRAISPATVSCELCGSDDGITYSAYASGSSQFFSSLRYAKLKLTITPTDDKSLVTITNLKFRLDIKYATDSGDIEADSTDVLGTFVAFNRDFRDVNSITVSCLETAPFFAIYDFTDVPDPSGFYVFVFDTSGTRVTKTVSWKARGVV